MKGRDVPQVLAKIFPLSCVGEDPVLHQSIFWAHGKRVGRGVPLRGPSKVPAPAILSPPEG